MKIKCDANCVHKFAGECNHLGDVIISTYDENIANIDPRPKCQSFRERDDGKDRGIYE